MLQIDTYPPQPPIRSKLWFAGFCIIHLLIWTIVPALSLGSVPQDTLEGIVWGNQWQWGYDKHPPLAAWLSALATKLGGTVGWPVYLLAQIAIILSFWAIWRIARRFLPPLYALISIMLLEGIMYYNLLSPKFNPGTLMTPVWALLMFASYAAIRDQKFWQWLLVGVAVAANIYTKYQAPFIILPLLVVLLITPEGRASFKKPGIYCSVILCVALLWPHIQWSIQHHFQELSYALERTAEGNRPTTIMQKILNHITNPANLILSQLGAMAGLFIMLIPFYYCRRVALHINDFDKQFLYIVGLGPMALTVLYSVVTGDHVHGTWCTPYFSLFGILALVILQPEISKRQFKWFVILFTSLLLLAPIGQYGGLAVAPYLTHKADAKTYIPGKNIAEAVTTQWHERYHTKLPYVAGSHYLLVYISAYSPDHPIPYFDWDMNQSAWIDEAQLREQGAVFLWYIDNPEKAALPAEIQQRFPGVIAAAPQTFAKLTGAEVTPITIGIAFLPPQPRTTS